MIATRFAPSPTGFLHIGSARTALFAFAFARKYNGKFILRIEDTDTQRSTLDAVNSILNTMQWLSLNYDEGPFYQTKRIDRYLEVIELLLKNNLAYRCYCTKETLEEMRNEQIKNGLKPKYNRKCLHAQHQHNHNEEYVIRFKNPDDGFVTWNDLVKGSISIHNKELDDLVILRHNKMPTYNFCVVVDDMDMQITHVVRGDDHINNTPRQINILNALNANVPQYAHIPMILSHDGQKMSKRRDAVNVMEYKNQGILPEALLNYLSRLCWGYQDKEIFSMQEFIELFELKDISPSSARFDIEKLMWVNSQHIKYKNNTQLRELIIEYLHSNIQAINAINTTTINVIQLIDILKLRINNINALADECMSYITPQYKTEEMQNNQQYFNNNTNNIINDFIALLHNISNTWNKNSIKTQIDTICKSHTIKMPFLAIPVRLKLCGFAHTPSLDLLLETFGYQETIKRLT